MSINFCRPDLFAEKLNLSRLNAIVNDLLHDKGTLKLYLKQHTDIARLNRCNFDMADKIEQTGQTERVFKTGRSRGVEDVRGLSHVPAMWSENAAV